MNTIDKQLEVLQALKDGKVITYFGDGNETERRVMPNHKWNFTKYRYQITERVNVRPYANAEEFLEAQKEHGLYINGFGAGLLALSIYRDGIDVLDKWGHVKSKTKKEPQNYAQGVCFLSYYELVEYLGQWQDGAPCGIIEEA